MCGFAGVLGDQRTRDEQVSIVRRMVNRIIHRGPDDQSEWACAENILTMASVRLAVIDTSPHGRMPMTSRCGRYILAYNGEIYNSSGLRDRLVDQGVRLRGHSDTEILLESIALWGVLPALKAAVGMFAFALWDQEEKLLTLSRDRFGEKPLYWARSGGLLLFGSELEALRAHPNWSGTIDPVAVHGYLQFGWIKAPRTIYREAWKVPPASVLTFNRVGELIHEEAYWSAPEEVLIGQTTSLEGASSQEIDSIVEKALADAVRAQLVADVPVGAFLSGGIDSSLVTALAQAASPTPIRTFTIGFAETGFDESPYARAVARHLGVEHTELMISPREALDVVSDLPRIYGEPFADSSQIPTILVSRLARRSVTVALSGDGGDELFGGYDRYRETMRARSAIQALPRQLRKPLGKVILAGPLGCWNALAEGLSPLLPERLRSPVLEPKLRTVASWLEASGDELFLRQLTSWPNPSALMINPPHQRDSPRLPERLQHIQEPVTRMMMLDTLHYLPDDILVKVDRASMSASLETRAPFLDHRVFELACRLPLRETYGNGEGKRVLKRILARYVPPALTERPKMGFGVPIAAWLRGPLRSWAEDLLNPGVLSRDGLLKSEPIQIAWQEHCSGHVDHSQALWHVLMLQAWLHRS